MNEEQGHHDIQANEGEQHQGGEENRPTEEQMQYQGGQPNEEDTNTATEFSPGASQPTNEFNDSQGGIFSPPPEKQAAGASGIAPKAWQKKKKVVTTRAEVLRVRSAREKKVTKRYQD